jgi:hypothetical protein
MTDGNRGFHKDRSHMLIGALRKTLGAGFAEGCADNETLSEALAKHPSLCKVIRARCGLTPSAIGLALRPRNREVTPMGVNAGYRDKWGEICRKHGDTPIGTLRISYGSRFARGCAQDDKLSEVLASLDEPSLFKLVRDHKAGMLPIRLRTFLATRRPGGLTL